MARLARYVIPGIPHHVTQRGNGRQQTFFGAEDYAGSGDRGSGDRGSGDSALN